MKISDILKIENDNSNNIILHNEGLFWRAYELSAYRFVKYIKAYQITKKYFKNVNKEIVYCGFPQNTLNEILKITSNRKIERKESQINITGFEIENQKFEKWKTDLTDKLIEYQELSESENNKDEILKRLCNFPIASKSPIDCQQFLIEIQNKLNGDI